MRAGSERQPRSVSQALNGAIDAPAMCRRCAHALVQLVAPREHQRAAEHVAVAAEIFGGRMHHHVRAQRQRPLQHRRGEGVVADQQRAVRVREPGQRARCRRSSAAGSTAFPAQTSASGRCAARCDGIQVGHVHGDRLDAALRQEFVGQHPQAGVAVVRDEDACAGGSVSSRPAIAAMPEAKVSAASPPSSAAIAVSSRSRVGLPSRWYS